MGAETTRPGDCDCGIGLQSAGDLLCVYCQLAAVTKERDEWENSSGYYKEELKKYEKITPRLAGNCSHYLALLREIEAWKSSHQGSFKGSLPVLASILSHIPAEPAPCQESQPISPETNSGECQGCADLKAGIVERDRVREPVMRFAIEMERKLAANDDRKGGWAGIGFWELYGKLLGEVGELKKVLDKWNGDADNKKIINEAADVANYAMMIADRILSTRPATDKPEETT